MTEPATAACCTHERGRTYTEPDKRGQQVARCIDCGIDLGVKSPATAAPVVRSVTCSYCHVRQGLLCGGCGKQTCSVCDSTDPHKTGCREVKRAR